MPEGKHNLHLRHADEFNTLVEDFLEEWNHGFIIRLWRKRVGVTLKIKCRMWIVMLFWLFFYDAIFIWNVRFNKKKNRNMRNSFLHKLKLQFNVNKFHL